MLVSAMLRGYEYLQERSAEGVRVPLVLDSARERCDDHLKAVQSSAEAGARYFVARRGRYLRHA